MKRLFVAVNLPLELKRNLGNIEKEINNAFQPETASGLFKWVEAENLHITLLFIDEAKDSILPKLAQTIRLAAQNHKPLAVKTKKICYGPPKAMPPRLVWLELEKNSQLAKLAQNLQETAQKAGVLRNAQDREFSGHITLARIRIWIFKQINPEERPNITRDFAAEIPVNSIELMESVLKKTGPEYIVLQSFPLNRQ